MNNYPPGFDPRELDIPITDDECPACQEADMEVEYFYKDGKRGEETGDAICPECDHRENIHPPFETIIH